MNALKDNNLLFFWLVIVFMVIMGILIFKPFSSEVAVNGDDSWNSVLSKCSGWQVWDSELEMCMDEISE